VSVAWHGYVSAAWHSFVSAAWHSGGVDKLTNEQIDAAQLADWRKLGQALHARYRASDAAAAADFVSVLGRTFRAGGGMPDLKLACDVIDVSVYTREEGLWVTPSDLDVARRISELAADHRLTAEPEAVAQLELALDTADQDAVAPFWSALLTGSADNVVADSVFDPTGRVPSVWFQRSEPSEPPKQRWHFDLWLAPEVAADRIAAAVAAGGVVVSDAQAPAFTVLADADGNRVCVCTSQGRG
jgi:4a-hydroxytetrahydrobiopterin dehydratase